MIQVGDIFYQQNREDRLNLPSKHDYIEWYVVGIRKIENAGLTGSYHIEVCRKNCISERTDKGMYAVILIKIDLEYITNTTLSHVAIRDIVKDKNLLKQDIINTRKDEINDMKRKFNNLRLELETLENAKE